MNQFTNKITKTFKNLFFGFLSVIWNLVLIICKKILLLRQTYLSKKLKNRFIDLASKSHTINPELENILSLSITDARKLVENSKEELRKRKADLKNHIDNFDHRKENFEKELTELKNQKKQLKAKSKQISKTLKDIEKHLNEKIDEQKQQNKKFKVLTNFMDKVGPKKSIDKYKKALEDLKFTQKEVKEQLENTIENLSSFNTSWKNREKEIISNIKITEEQITETNRITLLFVDQLNKCYIKFGQRINIENHCPKKLLKFQKKIQSVCRKKLKNRSYIEYFDKKIDACRIQRKWGIAAILLITLITVLLIYICELIANL